MNFGLAPAFISHFDLMKLLGQKHLGLTRSEHRSDQRSPTRRHGIRAEGTMGPQALLEQCRGFRLLPVPRGLAGPKQGGHRGPVGEPLLLREQCKLIDLGCGILTEQLMQPSVGP